MDTALVTPVSNLEEQVGCTNENHGRTFPAGSQCGSIGPQGIPHKSKFELMASKSEEDLAPLNFADEQAASFAVLRDSGLTVAGERVWPKQPGLRRTRDRGIQRTQTWAYFVATLLSSLLAQTSGENLRVNRAAAGSAWRFQHTIRESYV
jgi:hypothetical protein